MENRKETPAQIAERVLRNFKDDTPIPVLLDAVEKALYESIKEANLPKEKPTHVKVMSEEEIRLVVEDMKKTLRVPAITYKDLIDIVNIYNSTARDEFKICDTLPKTSISEEEWMKIAKKYGLERPETEKENKI